jgi:hypothetical protein
MWRAARVKGQLVTETAKRPPDTTPPDGERGSESAYEGRQKARDTPSDEVGRQSPPVGGSRGVDPDPQVDRELVKDSEWEGGGKIPDRARHHDASHGDD